MLFNIRELLKSTVAFEVVLNDCTATLVDAISAFAENHDSRFPISVGANSMAASFGLDELYYTDDSVWTQFVGNYCSAYFRLIDLLVYDQIILDTMLVDSHIHEAELDYGTRDSELAVCLITIRKAILEMVMQLA